MGIEDIQISEELETNAPSIKYRGNEGPKSPQEMEQMMMASLEEEYLKYVDDMMEQGIEPMTIQQFIDQAMAEGQMSKGPILPSDEDPINPFGPKPQGPVLPDRQMAAYGGIMGMDGRKQYGVGSFFQKYIMDPLKNATIGEEASENLTKARLAREKESGVETPAYELALKDLFYGQKEEDKDTRSGGIISSIGKNIIPIAGGALAGLFTKNTESDTPGLPSDTTAMQLDELRKVSNTLDQKQGMAAGLNFLPTVASRKYSPEEMIETYAKAANGGRIGYNLGGRIGMAEGGIMDLGGMEKDYRAEGGFVPIGREEKADDVPARLSVNEFVFTADAVRNAGGGDIDQGAQVMENMMKHLEQGGQVSEESQGMQGARDMFATSQRLGDVI